MPKKKITAPIAETQCDVAQPILAHALRQVSRVAQPRGYLPVLGHVLLAPEGPRLRLTTSNLELTLSLTLDALTVNGQHALAVPAPTFTDFIAALPNDTVHLNLNGQLMVRAGKHTATLKGLPADEFPRVPRCDADHAYALGSATEVAVACRQVIGMAADDESHPVLTGVSLALADDTLTLIASDGFRLAWRTLTLPIHVPTPRNCVVPGRALAELARALNGDEPVYLQITDSHALFQCGAVELVTQLIAGEFPDVQGAIPQAHQYRAVLSVAAATQLCKTLDVIARDAQHTVRLHWHPATETDAAYVEASACAAETGDVVMSVPATIDGELQIALNAHYLRDALSAMPTDEVVFDATAPLKPVALRPQGRADYLVVVMPIQLAS